jgi:hypothetical protein
MENQHTRYIAVSCFIIILLIPILSACNFTVQQPTKDPNAVSTFAAATIAANNQLQTIDAMQALLTSQSLTLEAPTITPLPSDTPVPPTQPVPTDTLIPEITQPVSTQAPLPTSALMLTADVETRCRQGPNPAFNTISFIRVGQQAEVIGKNPENTWWLIHDPQGTFGNCWVWGETTRVLGDASSVPVVQPPPLPTSPVASFSASFANIHICGGVATATFLVGNNGTLPFQSSNITVRDLTSDVILAGPESSNNPFLTGINACPPGNSTLQAGTSAWVTKGMGILPPSGTRGRGIIVLCTLPNLGGQCVEQRANFNFP